MQCGRIRTRFSWRCAESEAVCSLHQMHQKDDGKGTAKLGGKGTGRQAIVLTGYDFERARPLL